jgi:hypothetical protein
MRYLMEPGLLLERIHNLSEFYGIPLIYRRVLFQGKKDE